MKYNFILIQTLISLSNNNITLTPLFKLLFLIIFCKLIKNNIILTTLFKLLILKCCCCLLLAAAAGPSPWQPSGRPPQPHSSWFSSSCSTHTSAPASTADHNLTATESRRYPGVTVAGCCWLLAAGCLCVYVSTCNILLLVLLSY